MATVESTDVEPVSVVDGEFPGGSGDGDFLGEIAGVGKPEDLGAAPWAEADGEPFIVDRGKLALAQDPHEAHSIFVMTVNIPRQRTGGGNITCLPTLTLPP